MSDFKLENEVRSFTQHAWGLAHLPKFQCTKAAKILQSFLGEAAIPDCPRLCRAYS